MTQNGLGSGASSPAALYKRGRGAEGDFGGACCKNGQARNIPLANVVHLVLDKYSDVGEALEFHKHTALSQSMVSLEPSFGEKEPVKLFFLLSDTPVQMLRDKRAS